MTYPKRLKSKDGGFTHVYSVGEEEQLRVHGWKGEFEGLEGNEPIVEPKTDGADEGNIATVTVKRGRKPKTDGADNVQ